MKTLITILLIICFLGCQTLTANPPNQPPQPKACLFCILVVIGVVVVGVMIWGVWKMCKNIPGPPPPADTNAAPVNPANPAVTTTLPAIQLEGGNNAVLQSSDGSGTWQTVATITATSDGTNMVFTALDPQGHTLGNASSKVYTGNGMPTAIADFSGLNLGGTNSNARLFRLVGTQ